jgi:hypothetical protein
MRTLLCLLGCTLALPSIATAEPGFTPGHLTLPPLSLHEAAKAAIPPPSVELTPTLSRSTSPRPVAKPRMRVIEPRANPDPHMAFTPNPAIDYKLRIVRPSEMAPGR